MRDNIEERSAKDVTKVILVDDSGKKQKTLGKPSPLTT